MTIGFAVIMSASEQRKEKNLDFIKACGNGDLDLAKKLYADGDVDINATNPFDETAMNAACAGGHLSVAQWLYSIDDNIMSTHRNRTEAFLRACIMGHLPVVQWLHSLDSGTISVDSFYAACIKGHLDVAKWIHSVDPSCCDPMKMHFNRNSLTYETYLNGHFTIVKWVHSIGYPINAELFNLVCESCYKHIDLRDWLFMLSDEPDDDNLRADYLAARERYRRANAERQATKKELAECKARISNLEVQLAKAIERIEALDEEEEIEAAAAAVGPIGVTSDNDY